jgi:hypothetical protein
MPPQNSQYTQNIREQFTSTNLAVIGWPKKFFTFAVIIFASALLIYIGLALGYKTFLNKSIENLDSQIEDLSSQITEEQKDNLATLYSQVTNVRTLLKNHIFPSQVFTLLKSVTHPKVTYLSLGLDAKERGIVITGVTDSYENLTSQLALLENSPEVERYNLESSKWDKGVVQFKINLTVAKSVFFIE